MSTFVLPTETGQRFLLDHLRQPEWSLDYYFSKGAEQSYVKTSGIHHCYQDISALWSYIDEHLVPLSLLCPESVRLWPVGSCSSIISHFALWPSLASLKYDVRDIDSELETVKSMWENLKEASEFPFRSLAIYVPIHALQPAPLCDVIKRYTSLTAIDLNCKLDQFGSDICSSLFEVLSLLPLKRLMISSNLQCSGISLPPMPELEFLKLYLVDDKPPSFSNWHLPTLAMLSILGVSKNTLYDILVHVPLTLTHISLISRDYAKSSFSAEQELAWINRLKQMTQLQVLKASVRLSTHFLEEWCAWLPTAALTQFPDQMIPTNPTEFAILEAAWAKCQTIRQFQALNAMGSVAPYSASDVIFSGLTRLKKIKLKPDVTLDPEVLQAWFTSWPRLDYLSHLELSKLSTATPHFTELNFPHLLYLSIRLEPDVNLKSWTKFLANHPQLTQLRLTLLRLEDRKMAIKAWDLPLACQNLYFLSFTYNWQSPLEKEDVLPLVLACIPKMPPNLYYLSWVPKILHSQDALEAMEAAYSKSTLMMTLLLQFRALLEKQTELNIKRHTPLAGLIQGELLCTPTFGIPFSTCLPNRVKTRKFY